jgi:NAD(P)-dependent dehydrogenase (short-subunit alcohol dehydrogenase family)
VTDVSVDGKVAIVTGGARGIGRAIVERLAADGAFVVSADRSTEDPDRRPAPGDDHVSAHVVDVGMSDKVEELVGTVVARFGRLDILVNNAADTRYALATELAEADWDATMKSVKGYFLCARAVATHMAKQRSGKIVNVSSIAAHVGLARTVAHAAAKGGVEAMTRVLAVELASHNIQVNAVAPGPIETPGSRGVLSPLEFEQRRARVPAGRLGSPADVAAVVRFLVSAESDWMTGSVIVVDGGFTILGAAPA